MVKLVHLRACLVRKIEHLVHAKNNIACSIHWKTMEPNTLFDNATCKFCYKDMINTYSAKVAHNFINNQLLWVYTPNTWDKRP